MSQLPKEIGRYMIEAQIGKGAMGVVYRAIDYRIYRSIAVKVLRLDAFKNDRDRLLACKLFLQEARIAGNLNHPNITTVFDMGLHQKKPYIVMELVQGKNLKEILVEKERFSFQCKTSILIALARAFHYAHKRGVLHRDIKPANIMILDNGNPKIMDFGIAGFRDQTLADHIAPLIDTTGTIIGTPQYMSPEHIRGSDYDSRSELFSLAIVAYEWYSRIKPFNQKTPQELMRAILRGDYLSLEKTHTIDASLAHVIDKALSLEPHKRFRNMEAFADALELTLDKLESKTNSKADTSFSFDRTKVISQLRERYVFFADFSEEELLTIFRLSQNKKYIPGEYLIREGTLGTKMFVILSGRVSIQNDSNGQELEIEQLGPGGCVGEMALVDKQERSASVIALEPTVAIAINETVLRISNPAICLKLYRNLAALLSEKLRIHDDKYKELLETQQRKEG